MEAGERKLVSGMPFQIIRNDITRVSADAIVNTANPRPVIGRGTDRAIYEAAGADLLLEERRKIGDIAPGQAVRTKAFRLNARYIIHTVGPVWKDGRHGEREILRSCYENSLALAAGLGCESAAFPLIASGVYGFPKDEALNIALSEIGKFLLTHDMKVILVVFDRKALELSENLVGQIEQFIDEHSVSRIRADEHGGDFGPEMDRRERMGYQRRRFAAEETEPEIMEAYSAAAAKSLDEVVGGAGETFQQRLFHLIDESGMDDVTVYKKANIDRKLFSRIRCKPDYRPTKKTALAFAVALELSIADTIDLLARAEIAFSPSSRFDLIVIYFLSHRNYDIFEINAALFRYGEPTLGA